MISQDFKRFGIENSHLEAWNESPSKKLRESDESEEVELPIISNNELARRRLIFGFLAYILAFERILESLIVNVAEFFVFGGYTLLLCEISPSAKYGGYRARPFIHTFKNFVLWRTKVDYQN